MARIAGIAVVLVFCLLLPACSGSTPKATLETPGPSTSAESMAQAETTPELINPDSRNFEYFIVEKNGCKGVVDGQGREVLPFRFSSVEGLYDYSISAATARAQRLSGFFVVEAGLVLKNKPYDTKGYVYSPDGGQLGGRKFSGAYCFGNNLIRVYGRDKDNQPKCGLMMYDGTTVVPLKYDDLFQFDDGIAAVVGESERIGKQVDVYDWQGRLLRSANINFMYTNGNYFVISDDTGNRKGLVDSSFRQVIPAMWDQADSAGDGVFRVRKGDKAGLIDASGKIMLPVEYIRLETIPDSETGKGTLFAAASSSGVFLFDRDGNTLFHSDRYCNLGMSGGFLLADDLSKKMHVLDFSGTELIPPATTIWWDPEHGLFDCFNEDTGYFFYSRDGKKLPLPESGNIQCVAPGRFLYMQGDGSGARWGLCDGEGRIIVQPRYPSMASLYQRDLIVFTRESGKGQFKYGLMDCDGHILLDAQYDALYGAANQRLLYAVVGPFSGLIDEKGTWVWFTSAYDSLSD